MEKVAIMLPTELISTATVGGAKPGHLLKAIDRGGAVLWILEAADLKFAVFLTGEYAGRAFEISPDAAGTGTTIGPVQLRVDPTSMSTADSDWSLKAQDGSLLFGFQAEKHRGWPEQLWAPVAKLEAVAEPRLYFAKWSAGVTVNGEWCELLSIADGQLTTDLETKVAD